MLVRLGITPQNVGWCNDKNNGLTDEEMALKFFLAKFKYISKESDIAKINGYTHIRLPNIIPKCSLDSLCNVLNHKELQYYRNILRDAKLSYSYHVAYKCNNLQKDNLNYLIDYYNKLDIVQKFLGIVSMHCTTHVNKAPFNEIKNTFKSLEQNVNKLIYDEICIENSEYGLDFEECLDLSCIVKKPIIFDNLHNRINGGHSLNQTNITRLKRRWDYSFLVPKIHYSNGNSTGTHSSTLDEEEFLDIINNLKEYIPELLIIMELKYSQNIIERLKYVRSDLNWNDDFSFHI